jgi:transcriptional regulator with XRE-family HTH domain
MRIISTLTDDAVMQELGKRFAQTRVDLNWTQEYLAARSGVGKRTLERLESGMQVQTSSLVRILRGLGQLDSLEVLLPAVDIRPMDMLKLKKNRRQRARSVEYSMEQGGLAVAEKPGWVWGDEKPKGHK